MSWGAHSRGAQLIQGCQENGTDGRDIKAEKLMMKKNSYSFFFKRGEENSIEQRGKMECGLLDEM